MGGGEGPDLGGEEAEPQTAQGAGFHYLPSMPGRKRPCWGSVDYSFLLSLCICDQGLSWRGEQGREVNPRNGARCPGTLSVSPGQLSATWHITLGAKPTTPRRDLLSRCSQPLGKEQFKLQKSDASENKFPVLLRDIPKTMLGEGARVMGEAGTLWRKPKKGFHCQ